MKNLKNVGEAVLFALLITFKVKFFESLFVKYKLKVIRNGFVDISNALKAQSLKFWKLFNIYFAPIEGSFLFVNGQFNIFKGPWRHQTIIKIGAALVFKTGDLRVPRILNFVGVFGLSLVYNQRKNVKITH